jgi:hypothetical protein
VTRTGCSPVIDFVTAFPAGRPAGRARAALLPFLWLAAALGTACGGSTPSPFACAADSAGIVTDGAIAQEPAGAVSSTLAFAARPAAVCCGDPAGSAPIAGFAVSPDGNAVAAWGSTPFDWGLSFPLYLGRLDTAAPPVAPFLDRAYVSEGWVQGPRFPADGSRFGYRRVPSPHTGLLGGELLWASPGGGAPVLADAQCSGPDTYAPLGRTIPWPWGGRDLLWEREQRFHAASSTTYTVTRQVVRQPDWSSAASLEPEVLDSVTLTTDLLARSSVSIKQMASPSGERTAWAISEWNGETATSTVRSWGPDHRVHEVGVFPGFWPPNWFVTEGLLLGPRTGDGTGAVDPRASALLVPWDGSGPPMAYEWSMAVQSSTLVASRWDGARQLVDVFEGAGTTPVRTLDLKLAQGQLVGLFLNSTATRLVYWAEDGHLYSVALTGDCSGAVDLGPRPAQLLLLRDWIVLAQGTKAGDGGLTATLRSLDGRVTAQPALQVRASNLVSNGDGTQLAYRSLDDGQSHVVYLEGPPVDRALPHFLASAPDASLFFWRGETLVYAADGADGGVDLWGAHRTLGVGRLGGFHDAADVGFYPRGVVFKTDAGFSVSRLP